MNDAIVLCSGGIDSVTTAYYVKKKLGCKRILILFFSYGQKTLIKERKFAKKCAENLKAKFLEIELKWLGEISNSLINKVGKVQKIKRKNLRETKNESKKFYVPCRNTIFLIYALVLTESLFLKERKTSNIFVGFKNEGKEHYPDTTKEFVNQMNRLSQISCYKKFKIIAPLIKMDKEDIVILGKNLGVNFKDTFSCYIGKKEHCGSCLACRLRQEGFYWAGIKDPTKYKIKMNDFRIAKK
ncbi:MAG: 7-cyano-7-deazaguanine synthase QueC [Nanoarchaeota archaeon]|mgnify:FL=1